MFKKKAALLISFITAVSVMASCSSENKEEPGPEGTDTYSGYIDSGKIFAAQIGDVYGAVANDIFKAKDVLEFTLAPDMLEAVRMGKADAAILDDAYVRQIQDSGLYSDMDYIPVPKEVFVNMASNVFNTEELRNQFNEWFKTIQEDGTFDEIYNRWIGVSLPDEKDIPRFELTGENGTLKVCNTGNFPPFSYSDSNNIPVGFDEEIVYRFAEHLGMDIEYSMMAYDAIIPYVNSGKADMSACSFTVTDDRSDSVIFGEPYMKAKAVLVVNKNDGTAPVRDYSAFNGEDIAVITGVLTYNTTERIGGNPIEYIDSASAAEDVRLGRVAGYMHALTAVQVMAAQMDGFVVIPVPKEIFSAQVAGISQNQEVISRFNTFLAAAEADGTLEDMKNRWFGDELDLDAPVPQIENSGVNGTLEVAVCSDSIPYVFAGADGEYSGFSTELALRFGAYEGKTVVFTDMEFGGLIPYIISGKADIGLANMAITEERKQSVMFTDPFFDEGHGILALKENNEAVTGASPVFNDFIGATLGIPNGYVLDTMIEDDLSGTVVYYSETSAGIEDVRNDRISGFMTDLSIARVIVNQPENSDLTAVAVPEELFSGPLGAISSDGDIIKRFNDFLAGIEADGTLKKMQNYWIEENPGSDPPMPEIPLTGENGELKAAIGSGSIPFCYIGADGEIKGFCAELILRFAAHEGMTVDFTEMEFSSLIPYVESGKADIGIDAVTITEERKKSVFFTEPFYYDLIGIIAKNTVPASAGNGLHTYRDLSGKKIGGVTGGAWVDAVNKLDAEPVYYTLDTDGLEDVRAGRLFGHIYDLSAAKAVVSMNDDLDYIEIPKSFFSAPMGAISSDQSIIDRFNKFLSEVKSDGTLTDMQERWLNNIPDPDLPMLEIKNDGTAGVIKVATCGTMLPFSYVGADGKLKGYSIELALRFGAYENMKIEFTDMDFNALIPYIISQKADLSISAMSITEERRQSVLFTDSVYDDQWGVIVLKQSGDDAVRSGGFAEWLRTGIERNLITDNRWKMVVSGLGVTMTIALLSQVFGTVLASAVCFILTRKNKFIKWLGNFYCGLIHGTPIVVLLMITYYIIFGNTNISNVLIAVAAFTMITGAGVAVNLKGAIETVDPVEIEAARSIGFSAFKAFRAVTLPQAIRRALPGYTNGFVELVKATAIVGYIAIQDLTRAGDIIRSRTYDAYFPLLFVALIYLIVTTICVQVFKLIIRRINGVNAQKINPRLNLKPQTPVLRQNPLSATDGDSYDADPGSNAGTAENNSRENNGGDLK